MKNKFVQNSSKWLQFEICYTSPILSPLQFTISCNSERMGYVQNGKAGMPWVLMSVKTSSKFLLFFILFLFFPLCCPLGIMGKRRVILLQVFFFFFLNANSKVTLQKKTKKKKKLHFISWPPTTLKVFWSRSLWLLIRSFKQKP